VGVLGKYSKFASAGEKAVVRQSKLSISSRGQVNANAAAGVNAAPVAAEVAATTVAPTEDADAAPL
jgi:hypothetical protein